MNKYFKNNLPVLLLLTLVLSSCGGGGDSEIDSKFTGDWTGELVQSGGISCSDGSFFGAGQGTKTRDVTISVQEDKSPNNTVVTINFDNCVYKGVVTDETNVEATAISAESCAGKINFNLTGDNKAFISLGGDVPTSSDGSVVCSIAESGELKRVS